MQPPNIRMILISVTTSLLLFATQSKADIEVGCFCFCQVLLHIEKDWGRHFQDQHRSKAKLMLRVENSVFGTLLGIMILCGLSVWFLYSYFLLITYCCLVLVFIFVINNKSFFSCQGGQVVEYCCHWGPSFFMKIWYKWLLLKFASKLLACNFWLRWQYGNIYLGKLGNAACQATNNDDIILKMNDNCNK